MDYKAIILMKKYKSQGIGLLLTGILGSLGLFYSSVIGGIIMLVIEFISGYLYLQYIIDEYKKYYLPNYHLGEFIVFLVILRVISFLITYSSIKQHNKHIDEEVLKLSEPEDKKSNKFVIAEQLKKAEEYAKGDGKKDVRTGTIIAVISFILITTVIGFLSVYTKNKESVRYTLEGNILGDKPNQSTYQIKIDSAWIYDTPNTNDNSGYFFNKDAVIYSIKERNGFIYFSGYDENKKTYYGWIKISNLEELSGCNH